MSATKSAGGVGPGSASGTLTVSDLSWRPHGRQQPTLAHVSLTLAPGERLLLAGASGSGKSTLLRALAGLLDESLGEQTGTVLLDGRPPARTPGAVGLFVQEPLNSVVAEYVGRDAAFGPENGAQPRPQVLAAAEQALDEVDFPYDAGRRSFALSGGELSRLALAGALALGPQVMLLDEPTAMLDPSSTAMVRDAVVRVAEARGLALVVVEHRLDAWAETCDRLVVLDGGRVIADGPLEQVLTDQGDRLLEAGIWVPGASPPEPVALAEPTRAARMNVGVRLDQVAVSAPDGGSLPVSKVELCLESGESAAVVGPSGVGKSTLLLAITGLRRPVEGSVRIGSAGTGEDATALAADSAALARAVGYLPQHPEQAVARRTVREEVLATSSAVLSGVELEAAEARAERLIEVLGLEQLRDADPYQISGGEQRRMMLAAALAHRPGLLLLDEPTVGQDRRAWAAVVGAVDAARAQGSAVLASTHDELFAARLDRLVRLAPRPDYPVESSVDHRPRPVVEPDAPPAGRCNPLALVVAALASLAGSFWVDRAVVGAFTLLVVASLSPLAVRRVRPALVRLVPVGLAALSVGWSTLLFSRYGWFAPAAFPLAAKEITRIGCMVVPGALLVGSLRPSTLGDALAQILRLPHRPVVAASAALLRLDELITQWHTIGDLRRLRGLGPGPSLRSRIAATMSLTLALLVGVLRSAQQLALSMDARGFAAVRRRTFALPSVWTLRDWACCAIGLAVGALPVVLSAVL